MQLSELSLNQVILIIVFLFLLLQLRQRKFHFWRSLIIPGIMLFITIQFVELQMQGPVFNMMVLVGGGLLGIILGAITSSMMKIRIAKDGSLLLRGSFIAMSIWFLLILTKLYGQDTLFQWGLKSDLILSLFLMVSVCFMIAERVGIYYRYLKKRRDLKRKNNANN